MRPFQGQEAVRARWLGRSTNGASDFIELPHERGCRKELHRVRSFILLATVPGGTGGRDSFIAIRRPGREAEKGFIHMGKRVLICDPVDQGSIGRVRAGGIEVDESVGITSEELEGVIGAYDAIVVRSATKVRKQHIVAGSIGRLQMIVRGGVGVDNIDVGEAETRGIQVLNTPAASSVSVAELAMGLIFAMARRIAQADATMKAGRWEKKAFSKGMELEGKILGIIGMGRIGKVLARKASAVGLHAIAAYDKYMTTVEEPHGYAMTTKDELLRRADIISLHIPVEKGAGPEIGPAEFAVMKDGVLVVNCARGGVVDERALLAALESGKVAGAALDVYEDEPPKDLTLVRHPNVICTPHVGGSTVEAQARIGWEVATLLLERLLHPVEPGVGVAEGARRA